MYWIIMTFSLGIVNGRITLHNFLLCNKMHVLKNNNIRLTFRCNTFDCLFRFGFTEGSTTERDKRLEAVLPTGATLPAEERLLLQFHAQTFSRAHQCWLRSPETALTVLAPSIGLMTGLWDACRPSDCCGFESSPGTAAAGAPWAAERCVGLRRWHWSTRIYFFFHLYTTVRY